MRAPEGQLAQLLEENAEALGVVARRLCRDASEAEDLVQDTLARALAASHTFTPGTNARAWLLSILHHLFIDRCRRRTREGVPVSVDAVEHQLPNAPVDEEPKWATKSRADVERAVEQLEAGFRDVYRLHVEGRSYEQISTQLAIPRATVGTRLLRARKKLRTLLFGPPAEDAP